MYRAAREERSPSKRQQMKRDMEVTTFDLVLIGCPIEAFRDVFLWNFCLVYVKYKFALLLLVKGRVLVRASAEKSADIFTRQCSICILNIFDLK